MSTEICILIEFCENKKKMKVNSDISKSDLENLVREKFNVQQNFELQVKDTDFDTFIDLEDMTDLVDKSWLKVLIPREITCMSTCDSRDVNSDHQAGVSHAGADNSLERTTSSVNSTTSTSTLFLRTDSFPRQFPIPKERFSFKLKKELEAKQFLSWSCKKELGDILADEIYKYTAFPSIKERDSVASTLVTSYPHLQETIGSGYSGWSELLNNKMKKIRTELKRKHDGSINNGTSTTETGKKARLGKKNTSKRPQRGEINWAPERIVGEDEESIKCHVQFMQNEMKKAPKNRNGVKISSAMDKTFSSRRDFINSNNSLKEIKEKYPALFTEEGISEEFQRILNINLKETFIPSSLTFVRIIIKMCQEKSKKTDLEIQLLKDLKQSIESNPEKEGYYMSVCGFLLLPGQLAEKLDAIIQTFEDCEPLKEAMKSVSEPKLFVHGTPYDGDDFKIIGEGEALHDNYEFLHAMMCLFGIYYICNIIYPKDCSATFHFIQCYLLKITSKNIPKRVVGFSTKLQKYAGSE